MLGTNPKRPIEKTDGSIIFVKEIFKTIQGEGPLVGTASIFLRLGGCNLACQFCDTLFEDFYEMKTSDIVEKIKELSNNKIKLVVITGGEPFRQNISLICDILIQNNFKVQIETNGTIFREINKEVIIVCSPKDVNGKYFRLREDMLNRVNFLKFLISKNTTPYSSVPNIGQENTNIPTYIQPMDELDEIKNKENLKLAIDLTINNNYILCLQTHKIIGVK